jgi:hypothetical protein
MATPYRNVGSIESTDALASTTGDGAYMDYDSASGYARFGAKGGVGTSLGTKIRTVLAGVLKDAITIAASGLTITLLAGSTLAAQAVTATTVATTARITSTVAGTSMRLAYDGTNVVDFAVSSVGGLTITPMANQKVSVTGFSASGLASFSAQTIVGDLFRVGSIATPNVTGLTGPGVEITYDPTNKGIIRSYDYSGAVLQNLAINSAALAINSTVSVLGTLTSLITSGQIVNAASATTGLVYFNIATTGGSLTLGVENASGGGLLPTSPAYATTCATQTATALVFGAHNIESFRIDTSQTLLIKSGKDLQLGRAYVSGVVTATGTIAVKDSSGTSYNVLVHT